jgi:hypothetical protein
MRFNNSSHAYHGEPSIRSEVPKFFFCFDILFREFGVKSEQLVGRTDRPWDNPDRRPSHKNRPRNIARNTFTRSELAFRSRKNPRPFRKTPGLCGLSLSGLMVNYLKCSLKCSLYIDQLKNDATAAVKYVL